MIKLFTVKDKFRIEGKGLGIVGVTDDDRLSVNKGDTAFIRQPGRPDIEFEVLGFELLRNTWSPDKPRNMAMLLSDSIGIDTVALDAEVWCDL